MTEEKASRVPFAIAGLFAPVIAAWALLLIGDSLDGDWLLSGILALGAGMLAVNVMQRLTPDLFAPAVASDEPEDESPPVVTEPETGDPDAPAPRTRVLLVSSGLQGLSVALLTGYFLGDVAVSVVAGLAFGALGIGVSVLLSRRLTPA